MSKRHRLPRATGHYHPLRIRRCASTRAHLLGELIPSCCFPTDHLGAARRPVHIFFSNAFSCSIVSAFCAAHADHCGASLDKGRSEPLSSLAAFLFQHRCSSSSNSHSSPETILPRLPSNNACRSACARCNASAVRRHVWKPAFAVTCLWLGG